MGRAECHWCNQHSNCPGITISVIGAHERGLDPRAAELGLYTCGRGEQSRRTPGRAPSHRRSQQCGGEALLRTSRLTVRIDDGGRATVDGRGRHNSSCSLGNVMGPAVRGKGARLLSTSHTFEVSP